MAFSNINDINLEILTWIIDLKLFINLSILDRRSYILITNTPIYAELDTLKNNNTRLNDENIMTKYYKLGLINILKKLKKNNKRFVSGYGIDIASEFGHVNILEWFKNSGFEFKYSVEAIDSASSNGARINYAFTMHN